MNTGNEGSCCGSPVEGRPIFTVFNKVKKEKRKLIEVSKNEAHYIMEHAKNSKVTITGRHKKSRNKRYYADEVRETYRLLNEYRGAQKK